MWSKKNEIHQLHIRLFHAYSVNTPTATDIVKSQEWMSNKRRKKVWDNH